MVSKLKFKSSDPRLFPRRGEYEFAFQCWYCESSAKTNGGSDRRPSFVFVVWSALIVGGWVVVAWGRKSYLGPVKIAYFAV